MSCGCQQQPSSTCTEKHPCDNDFLASSKAANLTKQEGLLNIFCAIRAVGFSINKIKDFIVEKIESMESAPQPRAFHYEVWGFNEVIPEEERNVCMFNETANLKTLDVYSFSASTLPVTLTVRINGAVVKSVVLSSRRSKIPMNLDVMSGSVMSFEISTSDIYGITGWTHLAVYTKF